VDAPMALPLTAPWCAMYSSKKSEIGRMKGEFRLSALLDKGLGDRLTPDSSRN
jgi:hypothetical protein